MIRHAGIHLNSGPPQQLAYTEGIITLFLVFFIIVYLIYHYHQAYELARRAILQNMEDLEKAREIANVMNKLKANFLSNMSHEIRTPINGILGLSQVIALESKEEETRKYVAMQQQSGRRLLDTMTSILELSRLEAEQEEPRRKAVAINPLVEQCLAAVEGRAREKKLDITFGPCPNAPQGLSDEHMLRQVIAHVIGNAVKFTDKGGILVETRLAEADPGMIMIRVTDTGIGIAPEFMPRMYSPFEQESTGRSRSHEGTGLGLALAKKYIHSLKGEIRAQSEKGKGSVFTILLPAYTPA
jgi:signal transduction histidine kinase